MSSIAPTLRCLLEIRFALENGESVRTGLMRAINGHSDPFANTLRRWIFNWDHNRTHETIEEDLTVYQRHLLVLIGHGLRGNPIRAQLVELEEEVEQACREQIENFIRMLPFKMAIPVLLFQFPAFLILLLGPLLYEFLRGLK